MTANSDDTVNFKKISVYLAALGSDPPWFTATISYCSHFDLHLYVLQKPCLEMTHLTLSASQTQRLNSREVTAKC